MSLGNIVNDSARFKHIVKGQLKKKENLGKYITRDELIGKKGNETIRIPIPIIHIPRFKYGKNAGGVGQGDGEVGDIINPYPNQRETGETEGSNESDSGDLMDLEIDMSELEELVFEELGLPLIEPKGDHALHAEKPVYNTIGKQGVQKHFKRTYQEALKRTIASGNYTPGDSVIPITRDFRYQTPSQKLDFKSSAVMIYMLDVSGSMGWEERRLCRLTNSWAQRVIGRYHKNLEERFIVHTANAYEVEGQIFYGTRMGGGTNASSAFQKSIEIIDKDYPPEENNIYCFYYSDGGNIEEDNDKALALLGNALLPRINMFCYGECSSEKETFMDVMASRFNLYVNKGSDVPRKKIRLSNLLDDSDVLETLRVFLNKNQVPFYQA